MKDVHGFFNDLKKSMTTPLPWASMTASYTQNKNKSRPRLLDGAECLGLTLMWAHTRGPASFISHPTKPNNNPPGCANKKYLRLVQEKVYGAMDGDKLYLQQARDVKIQDRGLHWGVA
eukprot:10517884-Ditylum_brightwellii.AAC.1